MAELTLDVARKILDAALAKGVEKKLKPLVITILDARGCVKVTAAQDGTSLMRAEIAHGKAYGALAMGMGSRALFQRAQEQAYFVSAVNALAQAPGAGHYQFRHESAFLCGTPQLSRSFVTCLNRLEHGLRHDSIKMLGNETSSCLPCGLTPFGTLQAASLIRRVRLRRGRQSVNTSLGAQDSTARKQAKHS